MRRVSVIFLLLTGVLYVLESTVWAITVTTADTIGHAIEGDDNTALNGKLIFAHVIYRHGDRTPVNPYPTDPWNNVTFWPTGWGQLTTTGMQQHYALGQWLRKRYDSILSRHYTLNEIYIRSTDVDRAMMSALSNLAGLYPPVGNEVWDKDIPWQPIPVHSVRERNDIEMGKAPCPAYDYAYSALMNSLEFQKLKDRYAYLFEYLTKYTGRPVDTLEDIQYLNSTLFIEQLYNKPLPDWTKSVFASPDMTYIANFGFAVNTYTRQMARLKAGPLIKEMLDRMVSKTSGKLSPDRSVWMYSGHDTTIGNILNSLKLFELHSPPYTSCIMVELRLDDKHMPFVSIFYKNTTAEPTALNIPGCGRSCPLDKMYTLYRDILPKDWTAECKVGGLMMSYEQINIGIVMGILVSIVAVMLCLSYIITVYYRRRSYRSYFSYIRA